MSRSLASCLAALTLAAPLALSACESAPREAPAPPPIAAKKPEPPKAEPPPPAAPAAAVKPAPAPSPTVLEENRSAPGAIPPSVLPDPNAQPADKPVDPLVWMQSYQAHQADYERRKKEAEEAVASAAAEVPVRERIVLEFKNPFLPRPQLSQEEADAVAAMTSNVDRVKWAEEKLAAAKTRLADAQKHLDEVQANPPLN
jgi:hypothetical protein